MHAEENECDHGAHGGAIRNPKQIRFGEWIPQQGLVSGARRGQAQADHSGQKDSRQPNIEEDCLLLRRQPAITETSQ
jgi:hypothetical protein